MMQEEQGLPLYRRAGTQRYRFEPVGCGFALRDLENREIKLNSVKATLEGPMDIQGILGIDSDVRNGFSDITVNYEVDADASEDDIAALVAQSQKRSAVFDIIANPTNVTVTVNK